VTKPRFNSSIRVATLARPPEDVGHAFCPPGKKYVINSAPMVTANSNFGNSGGSKSVPTP